MTRTTAAALAGCLVLAVTVSGCTSGSKPKANYSTAVSSSPASATTSAAAPTAIPTTGPNVQPGETPPAPAVSIQDGTAQGALAFIALYIRSIDWVYATSRPDVVSPFYAPSCTTCASSVAFLQDQLVNGAHVQGGRLSLQRQALVTNDGRAGATFAVSSQMSVAAASVVSTSGATTTSFPPATSVTLTDWLTWSGSRWFIVEERLA